MSKGTTGFHTLAPEINPSWLRGSKGIVKPNYNFAGQLILALPNNGGTAELHVCYHEPANKPLGSFWKVDIEQVLNDYTGSNEVGEIGTSIDFVTVPNSFNFTYYNSNPEDVSWYEPAFNDLLQSDGTHVRGDLQNREGNWEYKLSSMSSFGSVPAGDLELWSITSVDDLVGSSWNIPGYEGVAQTIANNALAKGVIWQADGTPHSILFISPYIHITDGSSSSGNTGNTGNAGNTGNTGNAGSAASILPRPASTSVTAPSAPASTSLSTSGGSIFLAHSAANPAPSETDMIPQPSDFLSSGTSSSVPTNPFTFTGVTNNALNTIYYFLMDAAQNISFQDKLSFYNDQDAPVITPNIPSAAAPYTEIWLGPNKPHLDGSIEVNDNPMGGETSTAWDVSMRRPPPLQPGQSYNTDKGADPSLTGYTESLGGVLKHLYGMQAVQMNDAGDEIVCTAGNLNSGLLIFQYNGTNWNIATGETSQGLYDSTWGGNVTNAVFCKGPSDYVVAQNRAGVCLVRKKVGGAWQNDAVWVSPQLHASSSVPATSCPVDTSTGMDRFVCLSLNDQVNAYFTVYKKDSGDSWSIEETLGPVPYGAGFYGIKMTDDGSRVITTGENNGMTGDNGKIYVWTRSGTTWTRQADVSNPAPISSGIGSSVNAGTVDYANQLAQPFQMGKGGFDISSDGEWLITSSGDGSYNNLYLDGGEIFFYQWTGSTYTLRQRMKVSSFCDHGVISTSFPDGASLFGLNGNGTRAVIPIKYQHEYQRGREKLWVLERTGTTWAAAKYLTLADPSPWTDTGTLVTSSGYDYMLHHASYYRLSYPDIEGYTFSLGERPSSMNKAGDIIVTCTNLLNYRHSQQAGAVVWRL